MQKKTSEQGSTFVELAGVMVLLFIVLLLSVALIRMLIAVNMLDYVSVQTSQCMKYGSKDMRLCINNATEDLELLITPDDIKGNITYYDSLKTYGQTQSTHKQGAIGILRLSYKFLPEMELLENFFPEETTLTSTAAVRIER